MLTNPKLTNILLIALVTCNILFFAVAHCSAHHRRHHNTYYSFRGREHGSFGNFHRGFEAHRGDYGGSRGSFRNCNCDRSESK